MSRDLLIGLIIATGTFMVILNINNPSKKLTIESKNVQDGLPLAFERLQLKPLDLILKMQQLDGILNIRKLNILRRCKKYNKALTSWEKSFEYSSPPRSVVSLIGNTQAGVKLDICLTAKSGTAFWKSVFAYLLGSKKLVRDQKLISENDYKGKTVNYIYRTWIKQKEKHRHSFVIVRSIWSRLVSLYRQKLLNTTDRPWSFDFINACNGKRINPSTFENMLQCILKLTPETRLDVHWTPAIYRCHICDGIFDYIIRTECMPDENIYVLHKAGMEPNKAQDILSFVRNVTRRNSEQQKPGETDFQLIQQFYASVSNETMTALVNLYRLENLILGYPLTPFEPLALDAEPLFNHQ